MLNLPRLLCVLSLIFLVSCDDANAKNVWRYKVTVEIETPEGIKTGSAVRQLTRGRPGITSQESGNPAKISGEAVVVDLEERGVVFAILSNQSWKNALYSAFSPIDKTIPKTDIAIGNVAELKENFPTIVTFSDMDDPKTIQVVYSQPTGWGAKKEDLLDNFEDIFGEGVKLKRIMVEITDAPVTWLVKKHLRWLPEYYNKRFDGNRYGTIKAKNRIANAFSSGAFSAGGKND